MLLWNKCLHQRYRRISSGQSKALVMLISVHSIFSEWGIKHIQIHPQWKCTIFLQLFLLITSLHQNLYRSCYCRVVFISANKRVAMTILNFLTWLLSILRFTSWQENISARLSRSVSGEDVLIKLLIRAQAWTRVEMLVLMSHEYVVLPTGTGPTSSSIINAEVVGDREKSHKQSLIKLSKLYWTRK